MAVLILPGTATAANVLSGKTFSAGANYGAAGTMTDRSGTGQSATPVQSGTTLQLYCPATGYYDTASLLTATDANWIAGNIPNGMTLFGLTGDGTNVKRWASGTLTTTSGQQLFDITGLAFNPTKAFYYQNATYGGTNGIFGAVSIVSSSNDIWDNGFAKGIYSGLITTTKNVNTYNPTFGSGQITNMQILQFSGTTVPIIWFAFE